MAQDGTVIAVFADHQGAEAAVKKLAEAGIDMQVTLAEHSIRMDGIATRLDRIEWRLDLVDPAVPGYPGCP